MPKKQHIFWLLFFIVMGLLLRLNNLAGRSIWNDEFFTFFISTGHGSDADNYIRSLSGKESPDLLKAKDLKPFLRNDTAKNIKDVVGGVLRVDTHPPLYFCLMFYWMRLFGDTALAVRSLSLLMGLLLIFLAYMVTRHLFDENAGIFAAFFVAVSSFAVRYSQEARSYALIMVLGLSAMYFLSRLERYNRNRDILFLAITNSLGIYTHYFFIFIVSAQFLYFSLMYRKKKNLLDKFYLAFLIQLLSLFPLYMFLVSKGYQFGNALWIFGHPGSIEKIYNLLVGSSRYIFMPGFSNKIALFLSISAGLFIFMYLFASAAGDIYKKHPKSFLFCLLLFFVPLLGMFFIDIVQQGALLKQERFWIFPFLGVIPIMGYALSYNFLKHRLFTGMIIMFMLISSITAVNLQFGPAPKKVSIWINKKAQGRSAAVMVFNARSVVYAQSYYLDDDIYLLPASNTKQFINALSKVAAQVDKVFIIHHYNLTDPSLIDQPFAEAKALESAFRLKSSINSDYITASEYVKCGL